MRKINRIQNVFRDDFRSNQHMMGHLFTAIGFPAGGSGRYTKHVNVLIGWVQQ
jgi:hypothetical protein